MKKKLDIIYEDKHLLVVNKPYGILTVSTYKENERTMYHMAYSYQKQKHKSNKIFIVHRLDKDTSGVLIFAKDEKTKYLLQDNWDNLVLSRNYMAVVHGKISGEGVIKSYLKESSRLKVYSTNDKSGKLAITKYKVISNKKSSSLVDIEILTGRKNQIRVHFSDINNPILGDRKYGIKDNSNRLLLHAYKIVIKNPYTNEVMEFKAKLPKEFEKYIKEGNDKNGT